MRSRYVHRCGSIGFSLLPLDLLLTFPQTTYQSFKFGHTFMILMYIRPGEITHDFIHTFFAVKTHFYKSWDWGMYTNVVQSVSLSFYLIFRLLILKQHISHLNLTFFAIETWLWVCESMCIMFLFICQENQYFSFMCLLLYHLIFTSLYISIYQTM